jgi:hypothetical protein
MTNPIEPVRKPGSGLRPLALATGSLATGVGVLRRGIASIVAWARLTKGSLRLGAADATIALDPQSRALLWHVLVETISAIGVLGAADEPLEHALNTLRVLADRVRTQLSASPPRGAALPGTEPPQIYVIEILHHDLQPCLQRWQTRFEKWRAARLREADWPLHAQCRDDLARTRQRLVERAWQLGMALDLPGLERLLPERPAAVPSLVSPPELAAAEAAAASPPDSATAKAGWRVYVEAATRIATRDLPAGPGVLGEAIASLDMLADGIRAELKAMPPPTLDGGDDTIRILAVSLLNDGVQPFLAKWRSRYRRFAESGRSEGKWGRAEACRAALTETHCRCLPTIRALGRKVGAPPLPEPKEAAALTEEEAPLQLPPPFAIRS